uniref:Zinc finger and BTB domain containing 32 n=1 Tax=Oryzias latipes TaxID=8090 RepID=A0A3P9H2G3_ORYLA
MIRINNTQYFYFLEQAEALRRSGSLCDVIIKVQSQTFRAHRLVLACASKMLAWQLDQKCKDSPTYCTLEYLSAHTFQQVMDFIYTQTLEVPVKDLQPLLRAAQLLEMQLLEDQCRKQLDAVEASKDTELISDVKEEKESAKESPNPDKVQESFSSSEGAGVSTGRENHLPSGLPNALYDLPSPRKRERFSLPEAFGSDRDSVITRNSSSSFTSPCSFPVSMWNSEAHLNTLRRIAENYSNLITAHPLQCLNQSSVLYPFSLSPHHMLPELSSHFQNPLQNSAMGLSAFRSSCAPNIYTGNRRMGSMIKHSLLKRKKYSPSILNGTAKTEDQSYSKTHKPSPETDEDCQHCRTRLLDDPHLGKSIAGCQFCGRGQAQQHETERRGDNRGEKPYQCKHCPKKFSLKHQLDTHHRVHTGEKPFECRLCGQRSRDYSAMIKHLRTHGGASPYQCTVCLEFCSSLVAMQRHVKSHALQDFPSDWSINSTYLYISHI